MTLIAHLSDTHIDGNPEVLARFTRVLEQLRDLARVDALVITGDLTDNGREDEYEQFFAALPSNLPTVVVAGNQDLTVPLATAARAHGLPGTPNSTLAVGEVTIVGLDSHIDHHKEGRLAPETLEFARAAVLAARGSVLLALHHPPVPVGHSIIDRVGLANAAELEGFVGEHDNVIAVLTGHVHTALATTFAGKPLLGAPGVVSTMRLGSKTDPISDPNAMPGLALHTIEGRTVRTVFHYLSPTA
jgi:3',5'-cyclic-AMP phosphodiesterase